MKMLTNATFTLTQKRVLLPVLPQSIREKMKHAILTTSSGQIDIWSPIMLTREKMIFGCKYVVFHNELARAGTVFKQCFNFVHTEEIVKFG